MEFKAVLLLLDALLIKPVVGVWLVCPSLSPTTYRTQLCVCLPCDTVRHSDCPSPPLPCPRLKCPFRPDNNSGWRPSSKQTGPSEVASLVSSSYPITKIDCPLSEGAQLIFEWSYAHCLIIPSSIGLPVSCTVYKAALPGQQGNHPTVWLLVNLYASHSLLYLTTCDLQNETNHEVLQSVPLCGTFPRSHHWLPSWSQGKGWTCTQWSRRRGNWTWSCRWRRSCRWRGGRSSRCWRGKGKNRVDT